MSFDPLMAQSPVVIFHALAALTALGLGTVQLIGPKGTRMHRVLGYGWAGLMVSLAAASFWINDIRTFGPFSPIHILSILTLIMVPLAVWEAHTHKVVAHRSRMIWIYIGALIVAGGFTLLPGRVMYQVFFGA